MLTWLKWLIAGPEMLELERWRVECSAAQRWLAEFDESSRTLENLSRSVYGTETYYDLAGFREQLRRRRDWLPAVRRGPPPMPPCKPARDADGINYEFLGMTGFESE